MKKLKQSDVILRFKEVHGNKYDYSLVEYVNQRSKVCILCPIHGKFYQSPSQHSTHGCKKCGAGIRANNQLDDTNRFITKSKMIHGDKYDYSLVNYKNNKHKVIIVCPTHGEFYQSPNNHKTGSGCRKCGSRYKGWSFEEWYGMASKSKYFDSYKMYVLHVYGNGESFYKLGITYRKVSVRFDSKECMPYKYDIVKIIERKNQLDKDSARYIFSLEKRFKRIKSKTQYVPKIDFGGMYECFK